MEVQLDNLVRFPYFLAFRVGGMEAKEGVVTVAERRAEHRIFFAAALLLFALSVPWRLVFFSGFGLGDDVNDVHQARMVAEAGGLNPIYSESYRMMTTGLRGLFFHFFGVNELSFIALPFLFICAASLCGILFARDLFGGIGAFIMALIVFSSPFETLAATSNVTDYIQGFFTLLAAWNCYLGYSRPSKVNMCIAAFCIALAALNKVSGLGLLPLAALATVASWRHWRRWIPFWIAAAAGIGAICAWDLWFSGKPLRWVLFNNFFEGYDFWKGATLYDKLSAVGGVWSILPRYMFLPDDYGNRMFGAVSWVALAGVLLALVRYFTGRGGAAGGVVLLYTFSLFCFFNFMPHKLTLDGYYSHYRVWRYLGQYAPALYIGAVYALCSLGDLFREKTRWRSVPALAAAFLVAGYGFWWTPAVAFPSSDANKDGRAMLKYFKSHPFPEQTWIYTDSVRSMWLTTFFQPEYLKYRCPFFASLHRKEIVKHLAGLKEGIVVTGGASLAWYGNTDLNFDIERKDFQVPPNWKLLLQVEGTREKWRNEPLRVWEIVPQ